jgi:hypothetical protein
MNLTLKQQEIFNSLLEFLDSNKTSCAIWGYAGTGKTYLMQQLIPHIKRKVVITAPTHKALEVIGSKFSEYPCITIHKLLGLAPDINLNNFNPESPEFNFISDDQFPIKGVVICDEASMINNNLLTIILSFAKRSKCKIIFLGDNSQLPPVKEERTYVFDEEFHSIYKLTEIIRTNNQSIQDYCNDVREGRLYVPKSCNGIRVIKKDNYQFDDDVILAYSNNAVDSWNMRWKEYHQGTTDIVVGDKLITNRSIQVFNGKYSANKYSKNVFAKIQMIR